MQSETELTGGNTNIEVVRKGSTVRRAASKHSHSIQEFMRHLRQKGFNACPEFLGFDEQGREILTYIEGSSEIPKYFWTEDQPLIDTALLLKRFHDAAEGFTLTDQHWAVIDADPQRHEVICHHDFAPYNFIFHGQSPVAVIDFDLCGPGLKITDIAYAAYWTVPLSFAANDLVAFTERDIVNRHHRFKLFAATYQCEIDPRLLDAIEEVLFIMGNKDDMISRLGQSAADRLEAEGHLDHWQREATAFKHNRHQLKTATQSLSPDKPINL